MAAIAAEIVEVECGLSAEAETAPRRAGPWRIVLVLAGLTLLMASQLAPLLRDMAGRVPSDLIDPVYNVWAVASSLHQLGALPGHPDALFNSNIYYPTPHAAVYGDVFIGLLPLSWPLHLLVANAVALTNALVVLSFLLSGYGAFLLGRSLTGSLLGGAIAAIVFAGAPVRYDHAGHLTVQSSQWLVLGAWAMVMAWRRDSWRWWSAGGIFMGLAAITNLYDLAYLSLPAVGALLVARRCWTRRRVRGVALATALGLALALPLILAYLGRQAHLAADYGTASSTDLLDLFTVLRGRALDALVFPAVPYTPLSGVDSLFPGCISLGLAFFGWHRARGGDKGAARGVAAWAVFGLGCLVIMLGHHLVIAGHTLAVPLPWGILVTVVHPLAAFRSPAQAAIGVSLALSVLAAYGGTTAGRLWRERFSSPRRRWMVALLVLALAAELWEPLPTAPVAPLSRGAVWMARHYPAQPALALPLRSRTPLDWMEQTRIMYDSTAAWTPLVNGEASVIPDAMRAPFATLSSYPAPAARRELRRLGVHLVVAYWPWLDPARRRALSRSCDRLYADALQWVCWVD